MRPPGALDHRRVQHRGQPARIRGGRHRQQPQFGAQRALQIQAERQRQIGVQRAFVNFVEQHGGHAVQARIGLQAAHQQPLGHDLDARGGGYRAVQPRAIADALAHLLAQQERHPLRRRPRGEAARLQHHDAPVAAPGRGQQRQRNQRGLARAGRRDQQRVRAPGEAVKQRRQHFGHRQISADAQHRTRQESGLRKCVGGRGGCYRHGSASHSSSPIRHTAGTGCGGDPSIVSGRAASASA